MPGSWCDSFLLSSYRFRTQHNEKHGTLQTRTNWRQRLLPLKAPEQRATAESLTSLFFLQAAPSVAVVRKRNNSYISSSPTLPHPCNMRIRYVCPCQTALSTTNTYSVHTLHACTKKCLVHMYLQQFLFSLSSRGGSEAVMGRLSRSAVRSLSSGLTY